EREQEKSKKRARSHLGALHAVSRSVHGSATRNFGPRRTPREPVAHALRLASSYGEPDVPAVERHAPIVAVALHRELALLLRGEGQGALGLPGLEVVDELAVHGRDAVASAQAGARGGRVGHD